MQTPLASVTPRQPRVSVNAAALCLSDMCGFGSHVDTLRILQRVAALAQAGENATSIMVRLNPPARLAPTTANEWATKPEPEPVRIAGLYGMRAQLDAQQLWCPACRSFWTRATRIGRPPRTCPACRGR